MSYFNEIYGDPELSGKAKMVLLYLHDRSNQKGESWYAINTIAKDLCLSRSSVKRENQEAGQVQRKWRKYIQCVCFMLRQHRTGATS